MNLESVMRVIEILLLLPMVVVTQSSHVKHTKARIHHEIDEVRKEGKKIIHSAIPKRYSTRRNRGDYFTLWTGWSKCNQECVKSRERYCKVKRKCGHTKHIEEKNCNICKNYKVQEPSNPAIQSHTPVGYPIAYPPVIHSTASIVSHSMPSYSITSQPMLLPVFQEIREPREESEDYFVLKKRRKYRKKRKPIVIEVDDYDELQDEGDPVEVAFKKHRIKSYRSKFFHRNGYGSSSFEKNKYDRNSKRNLNADGESHDYEDPYSQRRLEYDDEYADDEIYDDDTYNSVMNATQGFARERAVFEASLKYRRIYTRWSQWTKCTQKCTTRRYKKCRIKNICGREVLREIAYCYTEGSFCQAWLDGQMQKNYASERPTATRRKDVVNTNSIMTDFILNGKGYRGLEYRPLNLRCGISNIKSGRRHLGDMLKIIGGKPSRKGEWPWQVVIFNRFKEAFCGGTLIAPRWVLTAAHCVRKVLYVRLGEHNLDYQDGTEMEFKVLKTIKHPNYDKKTVDSDIALLRLPKAINATSWIGFSCMPHPYQPLPKNVQCTVIGWGKRRNRDQAGTSVLHQAEVPIISTEHCKTVYYDYSITKNMFCAGHKRGRIDTCAGDSGGPLLCRDTTKPNHPWTIFGITSFGDGCAKKNKFGIYAKVPNYVDWVWSVVNCNGNCKSLAQKHD